MKPCALVVSILAVLALPAMGYIEHFDGTFNNSWYFCDPTGAPPDGTDWNKSFASNYLRIDDLNNNLSPTQAVGLHVANPMAPALSDIFTDVTMSGWLNMDPNPTLGNNSQGFLVRSDLFHGTGYGVNYNQVLGNIQIISLANGGYTNLKGFELPTGNPDNGKYYVEFSVTGNTNPVLTATAYSADGGSMARMGSATFTVGVDQPQGGEPVASVLVYTSGLTGIYAFVNANGKPPTPIHSTFDEVMGAIPGDANADGVVNFQDFSVLQNNYGTAGRWSQGDFNLDGRVTFEDFCILQNRYGAGSAGGMLVNVPEPLTLAMLALGGLFLRRRK